MKYLTLCLMIVFLTGCASQAKKSVYARQIAYCEQQGNRAAKKLLINGGYKFNGCITPEDDARSDRLATACMKGGNIPDFNTYGLFHRCGPKQQTQNIIINN
tara:strand:- start:232 stop:537 length:306 start_codon:yes stop_codon:yes gene_type:complete